MSRKQSAGKKEKEDLWLTREESGELQMILDRLSVQDPAGESFEGYLRSLHDSVAGRPLLAAAIIDRLSRNPGLTGFRTFQSLEKIVEASAYKRSLKQAAYRFSQKGFTPTEKSPAPEKVILIRDQQKKPVAHLCIAPGTIWIVSSLIPEASSGRYVLITAFLEDDFETFNVRVKEPSTQKLYREYLEALSSHTVHGKAPEIPLWHAAGLFFDMLNFWTGRETYDQLERSRDLFTRYHDPLRKPYVYELMPAVENPEKYFGELEIEDLLKDMDLSWLIFDKDDLNPYHEKLKELDRPLLVVPREIQEERSLEVLRDAAKNLCAGKKRYLFRRFFEEQAMVFKLCGAEDRARWAWIAASNLAGLSAVEKHPVVLRLVTDSINFHWPGDLRDGRQTEETPRERRTESGIILP
ncbi:MAG TPA: hypothetical protein VEF34_08445 [Syntrophobacteraceae bacterium]|nr:hypothetical protein [Syntrophobacteraceae bacterium]